MKGIRKFNCFVQIFIHVWTEDGPVAEEVVVSSPDVPEAEDAVSPLSMKSPSPPTMPYVPRELQDHLNRKKGSHWSPGGKELGQGKRGRKPNRRYESESESITSPPRPAPPAAGHKPNQRYESKSDSDSDYESKSKSASKSDSKSDSKSVTSLTPRPAPPAAPPGPSSIHTWIKFYKKYLNNRNPLLKTCHWKHLKKIKNPHPPNAWFYLFPGH